MPDQKTTIEVELLLDSIKIFEQKIKELEKQLNNLQSKSRKVKIEADVKDAKTQIDSLKTALKNMLNSADIKPFIDLSKATFQFGKSCVDSALQVQKLESVIKNTSKSTFEFETKLESIQKIASRPLGLKYDDLLKAGGNISRFSVDFDLAMKRSVAIATTLKTDLVKTSDLVARAMAGNIRSTLSLMNLIGKSKLDLKDVDFNKYGNVVSNERSRQAILKLMDTFTMKESSSISANMTKIRNEVEMLKISIGKELLPEVVKLVEYVGKNSSVWIQWAKEHKELIANLIKLVGGIGALSYALTTLSPVIAAITTSFNLLSAAAVANPIAAIAIAIGGGIYLWEEYYKSIQKVKQARIEESLKPANDELRNMKGLIADINKNPLKIDVKESLTAIESAKNRIRELAVSQEGDRPFQIQTMDQNQTEIAIPDPFSATAISYVRSGMTIKQVYKEVNDIYTQLLEKEKAGLDLSENEKVVKQDIQNILFMIDNQLKGINGSYDNANNLLDTTKNKIDNLIPSISDMGKAFQDAGKGFENALKTAFSSSPASGDLPVWTAGKDNTDSQRMSALQKKFNYQKDLIKAEKQTEEDYLSWLESFKTRYKFTQEELLQIDVEIAESRNKIQGKADKDRETSQKKVESDFKKEYSTFKKQLDEKLKYGKITSDEYVKSMLQFGKENQEYMTEESGIPESINLANQQAVDEFNKKQEDALIKEKQQWDKQLKDKEEAQLKAKDKALAIEQDKLEQKKQLLTEELENFKKSEDEKLNIIQQSKDKQLAIEKEIAALKQEKEKLSSSSSFQSGEGNSPLVTFEQAFQKGEGGTGHLDPLVERWEKEKDINDSIISLEQEKFSAVAMELKASNELTLVKQKEAIATMRLIEVLQGVSGDGGADGRDGLGVGGIEIKPGLDFNTKSPGEQKSILSSLRAEGNRGAGIAGNMPQNSSSGKWSVKNLSKLGESEMGKSVFSALSMWGMREFQNVVNDSSSNNSTINNNYNRNDNRNIVVNVDNKTLTSMSSALKQKTEDFISLSLAGKIVR